MHKRGLSFIIQMSLFILSIYSISGQAQTNHSDWRTQFSKIGIPKYPVNFIHLNYVNPNAPKGGTINIAALGRGFDSFNPYIERGNAPENMDSFMFETLTTSPADDPLTIYGLLSDRFKIVEKSLKIEDREILQKSMVFHLNENARFHNGDPVLAEDVIFSYQTLMEMGSPHFRMLKKYVNSIELIDPLTVQLTLKPDIELDKLIILSNSAPIFRKKDFDELKFNEPYLSHIPNGTGPYRIGDYDKGRFVEYLLNENYWGKNLPIKKGQNNFAKIRYEFYFDNNTALEAFKSGKLDFKHEASPRVRLTMYESKAKDLNWFKIGEFEHSSITFMQAFIFNLGRSKFSDLCVRNALSLAMDIGWGIKNYAFNAYKPSYSFFGNSPFEAKGKADEQEFTVLKAYLEKFPNELPVCGLFNELKESNLLNESAVMPSNPKNQKDRHANLVLAQTLLKQRGWSVNKKNQLVNKKGEPFVLEILLSEGFERLGFLWASELKKIGINVKITKLDYVQMLERMKKWDYDVTVALWPVDRIPGQELLSYFTSESADISTSANKMRLKNKIVDSLIKDYLIEKDYDKKVILLKVLDRILRYIHFAVPHFYTNYSYLAYWDKFGMPDWVVTERAAITAALNEWWIDPEKEKELLITMEKEKSK